MSRIYTDREPGANLRLCSKCGQLKAPEAFYREQNAPDGRRSACKDCERPKSRRQSRLRDKSQKAAWEAAHRDERKAARKANREANPEREKAQQRRRNARAREA